MKTKSSRIADDVSTYVDNYTKVHKESLKSINPHDSWDMDRVKNQALRTSIEKLHNESKMLNIDEVSERIATNKGWNPEDIDFLYSLDKKAFYDWMMSTPSKLTYKIRAGLLTFRNLHVSNENDAIRYKKITSNVTDALKDISEQNDFNKMRIKSLYKVE